MPIRAFWLLHKNADRLAAEDSLRTVSDLAHSTSAEGLGDYMEGLKKQIGQVAVIDEGKAALEGAVYDRDGLLSLKDLGKLS